jgi:purine-binding chemotaxis protein CheW
MSALTETKSVKTAGEVEFVTFHVGDLLIGVDIHQVEEINRLIDITPVPHAPRYVCGAVNLRGEVVTVVDLREILGLEKVEITQRTRTVVVNSKGEQIGLLVDRIADVIRVLPDEIDSPPANVGGIDGRFFKGVYKLENELLVILEVDTVLSSDGANL